MLSGRSRLKVLTEGRDRDDMDDVLFASSPLDVAALEDAKRERRRKKVTKELFETEKAYLHQLDLIHRYFYFPLQYACIISDSAHARIFSNLEQLIEVNQKLLEQMNQSTIGQAFHQLGPYLKLYSTYANNHEQAMSTLQECLQKSSKFTDYLQNQEQRPELHGLKLTSLLITPIQRVPRYKMLLQELVQCTPADNYDYNLISEAAKQMGEIASHINEHVRQHENFQKMLSIQNSFDSSAPKLMSPGRQFIKEGVLNKVSRKGGKSHERMFFLFSDILLYGKPKLIESGKKSYNCCCVLPLKHCKVDKMFVPGVQKSNSGGMFSLSCKEEILLLYSDDQSNANDWINMLEKSIRKLCTDRQTLRKPSSNKIPLRGKSLRRHRRQQKKDDPKSTIRGTPLKATFEDDDCLDCSPVLRERLQPVRQQLQSLYDINISTCMSPDKTGTVETSPSLISDDTIENTHKVDDDSFTLVESTSCMDLHIDDLDAISISTTSTQTSHTMSLPWQLPENHTTTHRQTINSRLKAYVRKPWQRLLAARKTLRPKEGCSPFKRPKRRASSVSYGANLPKRK
ncbi:rho guanine nucleotide exchange factor 39 [Patella vulgata]|uniref:rho guanine nucleotide exchange factor 39 n=1 Tax=Patella vulgata TaxID=6465 RepID=UPI0021803EC7|nr:rho guanine nucleotide exchange factor 39 [Patella vulgata]